MSREKIGKRNSVLAAGKAACGTAYIPELFPACRSLKSGTFASSEWLPGGRERGTSISAVRATWPPRGEGSGRTEQMMMMMVMLMMMMAIGPSGRRDMKDAYNLAPACIPK